MNSLTRMMRGLAALLVLAALLIGLPVAMLTVLDADPRRLWPDQLPPMNELREYLWYELRSAWDTGELVVYLLIIVGWTSWLALTWLTVLEIAYQIRYGPEVARDRHHHAISPRRWIAGLVTSVILLGTATPAVAQPGPDNQVVTSAPRHPGAATLPTVNIDTGTGANLADIAEPTSDTAQCPRVRVVLGDTLWGLAERHLGNGQRYTEIITLNHDRLAPGGPNRLQIGWVLLLPPDATSLPDTSQAVSCGDERAIIVATGDTLSAIAARELGDPDRWLELFEANHRRPQADGRALLDPDIILPGWNLRVPENGDSHPARQPPEDHRQHRDNEPQPEPSDTGRGDPADSDDAAANPEPGPNAEPEPDQGTGVSLPSGAYVGLGLAALITIAMMTVWWWRRRTWVPGSWQPDDLRMPPVVRAMRIAHDIGTLPHDSDGGLIYPSTPPDRPRELGIIDRALGTAVMLQSTNDDTVIGVADGRPVAVDLARTKGLGLTGPGAPSAARALVVALLAQGQNPEIDAPLLLIPREDAAIVLDNENAANPPRRLHRTTTLTAALDWLEAELLTRTRNSAPDRRQDPLVVVAHVDGEHAARLRAILEAGTDVGLAAVLLGPWQPGVTIDVLPDGTVGHSAGRSDLAGARLFNLPTTDARELLDILGAADATTDAEVTRARIAAQELEIAARDDPNSVPAYTSIVDDPPPQPTVDVRLRKTWEQPQPAAEQETAAPQPPIEMNVLGQTSLTYRNERGEAIPVDGLQPKQWEVLTYLALHPEGARRDALIAAIWQEAPNDRPANPFHAQLYQIRTALRRTSNSAIADVISSSNKIYRLDPDAVDVDLWQVKEALRLGDQVSGRADAVETITGHYPGPIAPELAPSWLEVHREQLHRQVLAILHAHARDLNDQLERKLALLEYIRSLDPRSEDVYREIASTQADLGQHGAIGHTLRLLTANLAEIDENPSSDLVDYVRSLQRIRSDAEAE